MSSALQVNTVQFLLAINAALCIMCAYVSVYCSAEILGFVLLVQSVGKLTSGLPRHRENREFESPFFQTGKTQGIC